MGALKTDYERARDSHYRELAKGRARCKRDGMLVDQTGKCWYCGGVHGEARRAFLAAGGMVRRAAKP